MRKEQLHISNCYSLDRIEIAGIRILVISNYLVKNDTINILSAESMKDSEPYVFYIYPTYAYQGDGDSPFTIAMSAAVDGKTIDYEARRFTTKNSFRRNTQVNIRARITSTTNVTLDFNVSDWDTYTVNVPDFN